MLLIAKLNQAIALFMFWLIGIVGTIHAILMVSQSGSAASLGGSKRTASELLYVIMIILGSWVLAATAAGVTAATGLAIEYFSRELRTPVRRSRAPQRRPDIRPAPIAGFAEVIEDVATRRPEPMTPEEAQRFLEEPDGR